MGMDRMVTFPTGAVPPWPAVRNLLSGHGITVDMRMIDGELAFPDEDPPPTWRELRLGLRSGMVTVQRQPDGVKLVIWGNADQALQQGWNALAWAFAEAGAGQVATAAGAQSAAEFRRTADLPASLHATPPPG